jgi:ABC-2 type transport system permease protein
MTSVKQAWYMTVRHLKALWRQPWWVAVTLVQPVIWLLLYGALFKRVIDIPGFESDSYIAFLAPGVVIMTALFSAGWNGMTMIEDLDRGVIDRFLVSPVKRGALINGRVFQQVVIIAIQSVIIVGLALIVGAGFSGVGGVVVLVAIAGLLGAGFAALSNGLALVVRREETLIATMQFLMLPLTFLSSAFMQTNLTPGWIQDVARFNPVNWAVEAGREAVTDGTDWGLVAGRTGLLLAFLAVSAWFGTRALRAYQASV